MVNPISFFNSSGTSPTQRKQPVKRLYTTGFGGVPQIDPTLDSQNQEQQKAREDDAALAQAEIQLALKRAADCDRRRKADEKKRAATLTERLLRFAKDFYPKKSKEWRVHFVEQILADKPTAWEITQIVKEFEKTADGEQMFASALTTETGARETKRPAKESHRHPIDTGGIQKADTIRTREEDFSGKPLEAPMPSETTVQYVLSAWRKRISDEITKAEKEGKRLDSVSLSFDGINLYSLQVFKHLFDQIPEDQDEMALYVVYMILQQEDENEGYETGEDRGRRRRVTPQGWDAKKDKDGIDTFDKKRHGFKVKGLLDPEETELGKELAVKGNQNAKAEQLRIEIQAFHERNIVASRATSDCSASIDIEGVRYQCRLDSQHNTLGSRHIADIPPESPELRGVQRSFTDADCVRKPAEATEPSQDA